VTRLAGAVDDEPVACRTQGSASRFVLTITPTRFCCCVTWRREGRAGNALRAETGHRDERHRNGFLRR
jgi:hypothetical protein